MSYGQKPQEKVYDEVSLDEFVLVSIMQYLQTAVALTLEKDFEAALESCDYVWAILPEAVVKKIPMSPLDAYQDKVNKEVPTLEKLVEEFATRREEIVRVTYPITEDDFEYFPYGDQMQVAIAKYRVLWLQDIARPIIRQFRREVKTGLEATGLYINGIKRRVTPTSELKPDTPLPLLPKLAASQPR